MTTRHEAARESGLAAAPATLVGLYLALKARLEEVVENFSLETKTDRRAPEVIDGWLPPKANAEAERYPFLIVRPKNGNDSEQGADENARAVVDIIIGTYSDTDDGWFDVMHLIDAVRADLGAAPVLEGTAYEHVGPLTWTIHEEQPRPQWLGFVTTNWQIPRPQRVEARNPPMEG
jgi:hypothetical protein